MARGVDFKGVNMVISYDVPSTPVAYIHRIGRTGRAGRTGIAVTFFTEADIPNLRAIANVVRQSGGSVPDWMLQLRALSTKQRRQLRLGANQPVRKKEFISSRPAMELQQEARKRNIARQSAAAAGQRKKNKTDFAPSSSAAGGDGGPMQKKSKNQTKTKKKKEKE